MLPDMFLPIMLALPPKSWTGEAGSRRRFITLAGFGKPYYSVVMRFSLVSDVNPDRMKYSRAVIEIVGQLPAEEAAAMKKFSETLMGLLQPLITPDA